jgi:phage baseplate assembly protein V
MRTEFEVSELQRRLDNLVMLGVIEEADYPAQRVRVRLGELLTGWLPWTTLRAGQDRTWWAPEIGEQVLVISRSGDPALGVVIGAIYRDAHPGPADRATVSHTVRPDGTVEEYDRTTGTYTLDVTAAGKIVLKCGASSIEITNTGVRIMAPRIDLN